MHIFFFPPETALVKSLQSKNETKKSLKRLKEKKNLFRELGVMFIGKGNFLIMRQHKCELENKA